MKASERGSTLEAPHERVSGCACTARRAAVRACCSLVRPDFTSARALVRAGTRRPGSRRGAQLGGWSARARSIIRSCAYRRSVTVLCSTRIDTSTRLRSFFDFLSPLDEPGVRHIPRDAGRPYTLCPPAGHCPIYMTIIAALTLSHRSSARMHDCNACTDMNRRAPYGTSPRALTEVRDTPSRIISSFRFTLCRSPGHQR